MTSTITAEQLRDELDAGNSFELVDTRGTEDFESWHIENARNFPFGPDDEFSVEEFSEQTGIEPDDHVITVCAKGISSFEFAKELEDADFAPVTVVEGGMEAWSGVYDEVSIPTGDPDIQIVQLQRRAKGCLGYVVGSKSAGEAAVIDATRQTGEFIAAAETLGIEITHVLDTHIHADHVSGGRKLADEIGAVYHLPADATERSVEYDFEPIGRNEVLNVGGVDVKAIPTPGHTSEMVGYLVDDEALLTGDTLFVDSVGRTELEFGDESAAEGATMLYESLHRTILSEPDSVTVLPGHFTVTDDGTYPNVTPGEPIHASIGELRTELDVLALDQESFVEHLTDDVPEKPPNYDTVIAVNTGSKRLESEQAAVELELGPNRCAA